jgi:hypothetical protein
MMRHGDALNQCRELPLAPQQSLDFEGEIEVDGLVLMARPKTWTDKAKGMDAARL